MVEPVSPGRPQVQLAALGAGVEQHDECADVAADVEHSGTALGMMVVGPLRMRASERQRASGRQRPAWQGNAVMVVIGHDPATDNGSTS